MENCENYGFWINYAFLIIGMALGVVITSFMGGAHIEDEP